MVYSFEPFPPAVKILREHIRLNKLEKKVRIFPFGLGEEERIAYLEDNLVIGKQGLEIQIKTLDEVIPETEKISLVKIDVEGYELNVLKGGRRMFERDKPYLFIEIWKQNFKKVNQFLNRMSYKLKKCFFQLYLLL